MENSMDNKTTLQEYLDDTLFNVDVKKSVVIDGVVYWSIYHSDICEIMQKLDCVDYIGLTNYHILIKHDDLVEKYGDPFNFDDGFSVKGKPINEIRDRLEAFDFDFEGLFIDEYTSSKLCFIRANSIEDYVEDKLCNILNIDCDDEIGRLSDKQYGLILEGRGWFYFEV